MFDTTEIRLFTSVGGGSCVCQSFCQHKHGPQMDGMIVAEAIVVSHTPSCSPTKITPKLRQIPLTELTETWWAVSVQQITAACRNIVLLFPFINDQLLNTFSELRTFC